MTKHKTAHPRGATRRASGGAATTSTTSAEVLMKQPDRTPFPKIVSQAQWQAAHERLLAKEKAATRARDKLAAERRRQPMTRIEKDYVFTGPKGPARRRRCVSHLLHRGAWRRSARQRLDVPRSHPVWPPGRVGRLSSRLAPNATVHVVAQT